MISGVGSATVKRVESASRHGSWRLSTLLKLQAALESAGVEFTGTDQHKPGVCLDLEKHAAYVEASDHGRG